MGSNMSLIGIHIGVCVPSGCSPQDLGVIFHGLGMVFNEDYCYSKDTDPEWSAGAITTV